MLNLQFSSLHLILVTQVPRDRDSKSQIIIIIAFLTKMVVLTILANSNDTRFGPENFSVNQNIQTFGFSSL